MCLVPCYYGPINFVNHDAQLLACWDHDFKYNYDILSVVTIVSTIPFDKKCSSEHETFVLWQWDYFGSTLWQIALCMIQIARAVFSENSLRTLKFSILVKMLHNIFGHNIDYVIFFWCFVSFQQLFRMTCWGSSFYYLK